MTSGDFAERRSAHGTESPLASLAATPAVWLAAALLGLLLLFAGIAIEVYRHEHGADTTELISLSNPGVVVAFAGIVLATGGLLAALSMFVLQSAASAETVVARGSALVAVWTIVVASGAGAITYAATAGVTIGHEGHATASPTVSPSNSASTGEPKGVEDRATLRGTLTLDGAPLDAQFLGVRTIRAGLSTACQSTIPAVTQGRYEIDVAADSEVRGCGTDGAQLVLWTFVNDGYIYTTTTAPWPGNGESATFDAAFSSTQPAGASQPGMGMKGRLLDSAGNTLPGGTVLEAYVGDTLCGITSLRYGGANENLYTLYVAGPESIPECAAGATITFRINGAPARETAINDPNRIEDGRELDLRLR